MATIKAYCAVCQSVTEHTHAIDHAGEHLIQCQAPTRLVRACTHCVSGVAHKTNDAGETVHGNEEYRHAHIRPDHAVGEPYEGTCRAFIKLPATFDLKGLPDYLAEHQRVNDRSGQPEPPCVHHFPEVATRIGDSVCERCGKTHREIFSA